MNTSIGVESNWLGRYRPLRLVEMALEDSVRRSLVKLMDGPMLDDNLLLFGRPGVGKTTVGAVIRHEKKPQVMSLNASKDRGIGIINERVALFAKILSTSWKLVVMDEADGLTTEAQNALRGVMDASYQTRFVFTANDLSKIIEPLQSRCVKIEMALPPPDECTRFISWILNEERIAADQSEVVDLVTSHFASGEDHDLRSLVRAARDRFSNRSLLTPLLRVLVHDILSVFDALQVDCVQSVVLVTQLRMFEKWKDLTARTLSAMLREAKIRPEQVWFSGVGNKQGYRRERFSALGDFAGRRP